MMSSRETPATEEEVLWSGVSNQRMMTLLFVFIMIVLRPVFPETVFHLSCSTELLAVLAEEMEMKKEDLEGHIRPVTAEEMTEFPETGRVGPLSISDIHRCVSFAMERVHFPALVEILFLTNFLE